MSSSSSAISGMLHPVMWPGEPRTSLPHRRTKQACDNCKARKAKCSNTKPCTNCQEADILCTSVKATARKSTRDWEIERLRSERTRLVNAVKVLHQQLSSRAPELYAPPADGDDPTAPPTTTTTTKTPPPAPPAEKLSVNEIIELIELSQERKKHGGSDDGPIHVTPATPPSPSSSCVSLSSSEGSVARRQRRRRLSLSAGESLTPSNTPVLTPDTATTTTMTTAAEAQQQQQQQGTDVMAEFGLELDCVDDFQWQPPDGAEDLPSCWAAGLVGEEWPGLGLGGGGLPGGLVGLDGMDQLSMDWTAGEGGAVWQ